MYLEGTGVPQDSEKAKDYFLLSAEQGDVGSMWALHGMFFSGSVGIAQDLEQAIKWSKLAGENSEKPDWFTDYVESDPESQFLKGVLLETGESISQDLPGALQAYVMAAEKGHTEAQVCAATMYANGLGTERDMVKAAHWYQEAASMGHPGAQANLGLLYVAGIGLDQDLIKGVYWLTKAAEQGQSEARAWLNEMGV